MADGLSATDNLVLSAARRLATSAGIAPRARLTLTKNLPVASGIGGGSADAAAALRLLNRFWRLDYSLERLAELAEPRSEEHTSELQSLMRNSYVVFCWTTKNTQSPIKYKCTT